jgi:hypothetical protein
MKISPVSALVGALLAAVVFLSMAQTTVGTPLRVEYQAHPRDMVQINGSTPYTVPQGKLLVITGVGSVLNAAVTSSALSVNGQVEARATFFLQGNAVGAVPSMATFPSGLTAGSGSVVSVVDNANPVDGRAWGYLVNQ